MIFYIQVGERSMDMGTYFLAGFSRPEDPDDRHLWNGVLLLFPSDSSVSNG